MKTVLKPMVILIIVIGLFTGCQNQHGLSAKKPTTLVLWHNYGGQMKEMMDEMVDEFNETVGVQKGIIISVTSISSSATLHEKLTMIVNGDPGASEMPDITTANPKTAILLQNKGLITDLKTQFSQEELDHYVPRFIEEGMLETKELSVFPIAKSTEVLYLNKTIFDRFARETGASYEKLATFEGLAQIAQAYYNWTDAQTPEIENDGKAFYHADSIYHYSLVGCKQLSADLILNKSMDTSSQAFKRVNKLFFEPAVKGHYAIFDGYASDLAKTGEIACSTGSTAGVLFFAPTVTYPDNTTEAAQLMVLPYPVFEGGQKIAIQRGGGMIVAKSNQTKEYAAAQFLKWFTRPKNNMRFISSTGYLPVTTEAFGEVMNQEITNTKDENIKMLLRTSIKMHAEYDLYIPPLFEGVDAIQKDYETNFKKKALQTREEYQALLKTNDKETAFQLVMKDINE